MQKVNEMVSVNIGNYLTNYKSWNPVAYNAKEYGLVGDGVTDDTQALQKLVDLAISEGRKAINMPHGQYYVTSLTNADQVVFFGDNASFTGGYGGYIYQMGDWATNEQLADTGLHTVGAINARAYGAKGDGEVDDTETLQNLAIEAYFNKKSLTIPSSRYIISKPILIFADSNELASSIEIKGENLENTIIECSEDFSPHLSSGVLSTTAAFIVVNETFLNEDGTFKNGTGSTHGVVISDIKFLCENDNVDYGILLGSANASSYYGNMRIRGFAQAGMKNMSHFYLSTIEKVRVDSSPKSFDFDLGIKTSIKLDSCYSVGASHTAYDISGIYMSMINCCADGATGIVFDLTGYNGAVINPGSESEEALVTFKGGARTNVVIDGAFTFGNFTNADAKHIFAAAGANMTFNGGRLLYDNTETDRVSPGFLVDRETLATIKFNRIKTAKYEKNPSYRDLTNTNSYDTLRGMIHTRHGDDLSFIGFDGSESNGYVDGESQTPQIIGNAIYFGFSDAVGWTDKGKDVRYHKPNRKGDILLTQKIKEIGGVGWVQTSTGQTQWSGGSYSKIPIVQSGTTAERPIAGLVVGQQYYDTTIGSYIYYAGSAQWKKVKDDTVA